MKIIRVTGVVLNIRSWTRPSAVRLYTIIVFLLGDWKKKNSTKIYIKTTRKSILRTAGVVRVTIEQPGPRSSVWRGGQLPKPRAYIQSVCVCAPIAFNSLYWQECFDTLGTLCTYTDPSARMFSFLPGASRIILQRGSGPYHRDSAFVAQGDCARAQIKK